MALATNLVKVIVAWRAWKRTHDRDKADISCCGYSVDLFKSLDDLEEEALKTWLSEDADDTSS